MQPEMEGVPVQAVEGALEDVSRRDFLRRAGHFGAAAGLGLLTIGATTACENESIIGPPFYGPSRLGHTYRSARLRSTAHSYDDMMAYYGDSLYHPYPAIDFHLPYGHPIRSVANGTVVLKGHETDADPDAWPRRPGRFVMVQHPNLYDVHGNQMHTAYKHLSAAPVNIGDRVRKGQIIGRAGNEQSPNVHMHFDAFSSVEGFNQYEAQIDYGNIMFWQFGRTVILNSSNARKGMRVNPQPTKRASRA